MVPEPGALVEDVAAAAAGRIDEIVDLRRLLHSHPELSFAETATTELVRGRLRQLGFTEEPCPTPTGAVFSLTGSGRSARRPSGDVPTVLLRADIDGLPVAEATGLSFSSEVEGAMHACGHDAHTAVLLGVAGALASRAEDLPGRYLLVFQPAEEQISGAQALVDGGLLASEDPVAAIGWHVAAQAPSGLVMTKPGVLMAACKGIRVHLSGSGGHGALQPRLGNPVLAVARLADRLDGVVAGMTYEGTSCVCSPGVIHAGTAGNVVPTHAELAATLRVFSDEQLGDAWERLEALVAEVAAEFAVEARIEAPIGTGAVRNDATMAARVLDVARAVTGSGGQPVLQAPGPIAASDDVSVLLDRVPGCYFFVGGGPPDRPAGMHHSPTFDLHEPAMAVAAAVMAGAAVSVAAEPPAS